MNETIIYKETMSSYFQAVQSIQEALGKERAEPVIKALDAVFRALEERAQEKEIQIKIEVTEQVKRELKEELATKYDLLQVRNELKEEIAQVRSELKEEIVQVRSELKEDMAQVQSELKEDMAGFRLEMEKRFNEMEKRFHHLYVILIGLGALILTTNPNFWTLLGKLLGILPR